MSSVEGLAARILGALQLAPTPPIDVQRIAHLMGVSRIEDADLLEDGRLECHSGSHRILVRAGLSSTRRRFTVGHELGHLLLTEGTPGVVARRALPLTDHVERFCDSFAAALLLPRSWILDRYADRQQNLSTIRHLAAQTQTSMAAAVTRLSELVGWQWSLLRWSRIGDRWRFLAGAAVPSELHGHVGSASNTSPALDAVRRRTRRDIGIPLPVRVFDRDVEVAAQVSARRRTALALAELRSEVPVF